MIVRFFWRKLCKICSNKKECAKKLGGFFSFMMAQNFGRIELCLIYSITWLRGQGSSTSNGAGSNSSHRHFSNRLILANRMKTNKSTDPGKLDELAKADKVMLTPCKNLPGQCAAMTIILIWWVKKQVNWMVQINSGFVILIMTLMFDFSSRMEWNHQNPFDDISRWFVREIRT